MSSLITIAALSPRITINDYLNDSRVEDVINVAVLNINGPVASAIPPRLRGGQGCLPTLAPTFQATGRARSGSAASSGPQGPPSAQGETQMT